MGTENGENGGKWGGENGDSALFLEEKIGRCPHFPGRCPHFPASSSGGGLYEGEKYGMS